MLAPTRVILLFYSCFLCLTWAAKKSDDSKSDVCKYCRYLTKTFEKGMQKTENQHFAGGNTDWEERKLGRFKTSETRFVEVMEYVCKKNKLDDTLEFDSVSDLQFKCQVLAEENEELLETWFFKRQETQPDLFKFVCIEELRKCCPDGHFGPVCQPCPGAQKTTACFGRGKCQGAGTRGGDGKCDCEKGYVGVRCSNCDSHYFPIAQNETYLECGECFDGCGGGCTSAGPKGCRSCRTGFVMDDNEGCKDVDECVEEGKCSKANEVCVNTPGTFQCDCREGYRRGPDEECEVDVEASPNDNLFTPDVTLRLISLTGITGIILFVFVFHRSPITIVLTILAIIAIILIERFMDHSLIPDEAKRIFRT